MQTGEPNLTVGARLPWSPERFTEELVPNDWEVGAACRADLPVDEVGPWADQWFAPPGSPGEELAQALCAKCPVRVKCLELAMLRQETNGIWGGVQFTPIDVKMCELDLHELTPTNTRLTFVRGVAYPNCRACMEQAA